MPNIHPIAVHFPIALLVTAVICDFLFLIYKKDRYSEAGTILTIAALIGAVLAVVSGLLAEESVKVSSAAEEIIESHELFGFISLGALSVLAVVRIALRDNLKKLSIVILFICGLASAGVVGYCAYLGGELVYKYGTGVEIPKPMQSDQQELFNSEKH